MARSDPHEPPEKPGKLDIPALRSPPTMTPTVAAMMSPPTKSKRVRDRIRPTPMPFKFDSPEAADLVGRDVARTDGEWDGSGEDEKHPGPRKPRRTCMARRYPMARQIQRPNVPIRPGHPCVASSSPTAGRFPTSRGIGPGGVQIVSAVGERVHRVKESITPKVVSVVGTALVTLGAEADPSAGVGRRPGVALPHVRADLASGLVQVNVRVAVPGEGPRASAETDPDGTASSSVSSRSKIRVAIGSSRSRRRPRS